MTPVVIYFWTSNRGGRDRVLNGTRYPLTRTSITHSGNLAFLIKHRSRRGSDFVINPNGRFNETLRDRIAADFSQTRRFKRKPCLDPFSANCGACRSVFPAMNYTTQSKNITENSYHQKSSGIRKNRSPRNSSLKRCTRLLH